MSRVTALALYTTTFLSAFAACAIAQTPAGNDFDIVVTAEKREASVNSVPMSITAVTGEALQRQNITQVRDLERVATGFSYIEGTFAAPVYSMRGVGFNDSTLGSRPTVSVYVDETPLPFSILTRAASLDVQRVEVLKGPQGTLFGQNATGGAINYIAAKPGDVFETGFDVTAGNYGAANFGGFVSGPITDTLGGRMAIRYEHRDGWQESVSRPGDRLGEVAFGEARGMLVWRPTDQFSAQLSVTGYLDRSETQAAQYLGFHQLTAGASLDPPIDSVALMAPAPQENDAADWLSGEDYRRHNKFLQTSLRMDYDLAPDLRVTSLTSYITYTQQHHQGYDGTQYGFGSFTTHGNIHSFFQEFRLTGDTGDRLHWILGANYGRDSAWQFDDGHTFSTASQQALLPFGTFINYGQKLNQEFENWAVFANGDLQLTNALKAHAGVRYTEARDAAVSCSVNTDGAIGNALGGAYNYFRGLASLPPNAPIPIGGCVTTDEFFAPLELHSTLDEDNTSWRLGLDWSPMRDLLIYGNVSDGFKAGSFPIVSALRDIQLQPAVQEELLAYEIGVKATLMDRLHVDAAVFDYEYT
ncbi:MAG: TonB-dependent receptor, partial [Hyphomonadaceae bacterium]